MKRLALWLSALPVLGSLAAGPAQASQYRDSPVPVALASPGSTPIGVIQGCIEAAANAHGLPATMLVILLHVEGGRLGRVRDNSNATVDIGPMQVNEIWLPKIAAHWGASVPDSFAALRDNFCANLEGSAWILRQAIDEAQGDFWQGVAFYHSHAPRHETDYLRQVLQQALRLRTEAGHAPPRASVTPAIPVIPITLASKG